MPELNRTIDDIFVSEALECAENAGLNGLEIASRIAYAPTRMSLRQYGQFWYALAHEMQDEMLGMTEYQMRPGSFALMCHSILGATTIEKAIRRALWFLKVVAGSPYGVLTVLGGQAHITFIDPDGPNSAFAYRTLMIVLLGPICWLARRRIPLLQVSFRCAAPAGASAYNRLFGTPVQFEAPATKLVIASDHLTLPAPRTETALKRYLKDTPGNLLVGYQSGDDLIGRATESLMKTPARLWPDFDGFAQQFGMSPSTLRRRLKGQGASYRSIKADVRRALAIRLLTDGQGTVSDIAYELGYAEPSAFFRAFQIWTGKTPAQFRHGQTSD